MSGPNLCPPPRRGPSRLGRGARRRPGGVLNVGRQTRARQSRRGFSRRHGETARKAAPTPRLGRARSHHGTRSKSLWNWSRALLTVGRHRRATRAGAVSHPPPSLRGDRPLVGNALDRGASDVRAVVPRVRPQSHRARWRSQCGAAEAGEGGHEKHPPLSARAPPAPRRRRACDEPEAVAQPFARRRRRRTPALERILERTIGAKRHAIVVSNWCFETTGFYRCAAGESSRCRSVFRHAGRKHAWPKSAAC